MTTEIQLPDGQKATLKDKGELTNREIKRLQKIQLEAGGTVLHLKEYGFNSDDPETWVQASHLTDEEMDVLDAYQRTCVILRLVDWTLDQSIPTTPEEVDDLPLTIYTPLTVAAANITFGTDEFEINPNPKARTGNSRGSSTHS